MSELKVRVYSSEASLRNPTEFIKKVYLDSRVAFRVGHRLFLRDLKARYRQNMLGYLWIFILPLMTSLAFILLNQTNLFSGGDSAMPYPIFVVIGTLLWQSIVEGVNGPFRVFKSQKRIFEKSETPPEVILITLGSELIFNFLCRFFLILAVLIFFGYFNVINVLASLVIGLALPLLGAALGLGFLPFMSLFKDFEQLVGVLLMFFFYVTPIVYSHPKVGILGAFARYNPIAILINGARDALVLGSFSSLSSILFVMVFVLLISFVFWVVFRVTLPFLIERML